MPGHIQAYLGQALPLVTCRRPPPRRSGCRSFLALLQGGDVPVQLFDQVSAQRSQLGVLTPFLGGQQLLPLLSTKRGAKGGLRARGMGCQAADKHTCHDPAYLLHCVGTGSQQAARHTVDISPHT